MDEHANGAERPGLTDAAIQSLRIARSEVEARRAELQDQLDEVTPELRKIDRALNALTGEGSKPGPKGSKTLVRKHPSGVGDERAAEIRQMILEYARDHDEFRQVDIRGLPTPSGWAFTSSISATVFERLRQENFLRIARAEGNSKYYRLTREALRAEQ